MASEPSWYHGIESFTGIDLDGDGIIGAPGKAAAPSSEDVLAGAVLLQEDDFDEAEQVEETGENAAGALVSRWGRWLSVALHRANARNLRATLGGDVARGLDQRPAEAGAACGGVDDDVLVTVEEHLQSSQPEVKPSKTH